MSKPGSLNSDKEEKKIWYINFLKKQIGSLWTNYGLLNVGQTRIVNLNYHSSYEYSWSTILENYKRAICKFKLAQFTLILRKSDFFLIWIHSKQAWRATTSKEEKQEKHTGK